MLFGNINETGTIKVMAFCMLFVRKKKIYQMTVFIFPFHIKGPIVCKTNFTNVLPVTELPRKEKTPFA